MEHKNRFGEFIAKLRREKHISLEQLCDGLCDVSMLSRFERGEREPEKLLQSRFLTRLGAVPENYENFLYYDDYRRWEKRQGILHHILEEKIAEARVMLEEYYEEYDMGEALELQFYLAMLAQIRRYEGCEKEELADLFQRALRLTVPNLEQLGFMDRALSLEEINLLLEQVYCSEETLDRYEDILIYIEKMERTMLAMAKVYPKAVYYYYMAWETQGTKEPSMTLRMMELCDKAIEILRDANRMFYLWELFCMKEKLAPLLPETVRKAETVQARLLQCKEWRETLEEIYRDYGVTIAMYEFCYLYVESENYCIGDVIRIRRKMLGLSQKKLCAGLCDDRTVSRLERHIGKPQKETVQRLFDRLNLSTELNRTELVTDSQEAIEKYEELCIQNNNRNFDRVEELIKELKKMISMKVPSNVQALSRNELLNLYNQGKVSKQDYIDDMKKTLGCTVPYKAAVKIDKKYLTKEEISCLQNITVKIGWDFPEMQECVVTLIAVCENQTYSVNYVRMYEYIMATVSSHLGDNGQFDYSNEIKKNIISLSLKHRRLKIIDSALYGLVWNNEQQLRGSVKEKAKLKAYELKKCIQMGELCKNVYRKDFYKSKLQKVEQEIMS